MNCLSKTVHGEYDVNYTMANELINYSARALVKKTQEPGIKLQKADFFQE